jgi:hypothetical protein
VSRPNRNALTYSNVTATLALFIALGGASYAATQLPRNSVGSAQIKRNGVTNTDIANNAVTGAKVRTGSLDGTDIDLATLGTVPTASGLAKVTYEKAAASIAPYDGTGNYSSALATATCKPGQNVLGGGVSVESQEDELVNSSYPDGTNAWSGVAFNSGSSARSVTVTAICAPASTTG